MFSKGGVIAGGLAALMTVATVGQQIRVMFIDTDLGAAKETAALAKKNLDKLVGEKEAAQAELAQARSESSLKINASMSELQRQIESLQGQLDRKSAQNEALTQTINKMSDKLCTRPGR